MTNPSGSGKPGEQEFRLLADNAPVMIWRSDTTKACDFFNKPWLDFTGRTIDQEYGFGWAEGVHPEDYDRCVAIYMNAFEAREEFSMSYRLRRHDGEYRWILDNGRPFYKDDGFAGYFGSCIDVTAMKQALDDKDVLLREVHHRVRNNMQLISSLLELQAAGAGEEAQAKLREAAGRVRSIALAQEQLHRAEIVSNVDLGEYLKSLAQAARSISGTDRIGFEIEVERIPFSLDRAVPTGLIVNELLTNALKHAFPDGRDGTVRIEARQAGGGAVTITVADDGIGLPSAGLLDRPRSLGFRLIRRLEGQAGATIAVECQPGTRYRIVLAPIRSRERRVEA